jgi:hypothetical protein
MKKQECGVEEKVADNTKTRIWSTRNLQSLDWCIWVVSNRRLARLLPAILFFSTTGAVLSRNSLGHTGCVIHLDLVKEYQQQQQHNTGKPTLWLAKL